MQTHTVQGLAYDLAELQQAKLTNQRTGLILTLEAVVRDSAARARARILAHAFQLLGE